MTIFLATDHTGLEIKNKIKTFLEQKGFTVEDCGAYTYDERDDYPDFVVKAAKKVSENPEEHRGIVFGGSGQGEAMVANKIKGIRCALFYAPVSPKKPINIEGKQSANPFEILTLTREHNFANMLSIGCRFLTDDEIMQAVNIWLNSPNSTNERHIRRVEKIKKLEGNL